MQREQRADVSFAQADNVRDEDAAVGLEHLLCGEHRVLLVLKLPEILRKVFRVQLGAIAQVVAEVFGEKLEVEFIGREERERRFLLHDVEDRLVNVLHIDCVLPQLIEAIQRVVVLLGLGEEHVELKIPFQPAVRKVARPGDDVAVVHALYRMLRRHDVDLRVDVLLAVELHLQLAGANPLDELPHARLDCERVVRLDELLAHHSAEGGFDLRCGWRAFTRAIFGDLDEAMNDLLVLKSDEDADFLDGFERGIEPEKAADEKVSNEAIEVLRQRQDFFQPLAQRVLALIGEESFRRWRMVVWHFRLVVPKGCRIEALAGEGDHAVHEVGFDEGAVDESLNQSDFMGCFSWQTTGSQPRCIFSTASRTMQAPRTFLASDRRQNRS